VRRRHMLHFKKRAIPANPTRFPSGAGALKGWRGTIPTWRPCSTRAKCHFTVALEILRDPGQNCGREPKTAILSLASPTKSRAVSCFSAR